MRWRRYLLAGLTTVVLSTATQGQGPQTYDVELLQIESGGVRHEFTVEIALTPAQQTQGLMFRQTMRRDAGMLFLYKQARYANMWMRNTILPLDMLFIETTGRISRIVKRTVPQSLETISSRGPVLAVLELNAGTVERFGISVGDRVLHSAFDVGR